MMKLSDLVSFRKDLLFNGAVQVSWLENDLKNAQKAARHFVFHGPDYHGVNEVDFLSSSHKLIDTANFTLDILQRLTGDVSDDPFMLAIAGYGTGKSHLGVTLTSLLREPSSETSKIILNNIHRADSQIGKQVSKLLISSKQPYLVVTINGMQDFDLTSEITRQVLLTLNKNGLDTTVLENLRPRFKTAVNFVEAFYKPLKEDFEKTFGKYVEIEELILDLKSQDEKTFGKVSKIYEHKMGSPIHAVGQESLHDFIKVAKETYCGIGKHFAGILIIFDEFGRYLEFAVQKPHVAGSGALQQLFECVQANEDKVFLTCFIQFEIKAYIARVAPELREDVNRYVTRYDTVRKVRLSTNIETLIANLLEKKKPALIEEQIEHTLQDSEKIHNCMKKWFPEIKNHSLWKDQKLFEKIVLKGCWPMHPLSTWVLYKLSTVGKSLQQRSALSLLAEVYDSFKDLALISGKTIVPVDFCNEAMVSEFLASERFGQQGAIAHAYENTINKYKHELTMDEKLILKAVLMSSKIGFRVDSKESCMEVLTMFSGLEPIAANAAIQSLEGEYAVLDWNPQLHQYEITGDAIPKRAFLAYIEGKVSDIDSATRANIFSQNYKKWSQKEILNTDFGIDNQITTKDWSYKISFSNISMLEGLIDYAVRTWRDTVDADDAKGHLIYCYVGPQSNIDSIKDWAFENYKSSLTKNQVQWGKGAPISVLFLHDKEGVFGEKLAEYWILQEQMNDEDSKKYNNFILERKNIIEKELENYFSELEKERNIIFATEKEVQTSRIKNMLTQLFQVIYPKIIPFNFDGFHTAKGNAAKDSQLFTKELIVGRLDKEWISTCNPKQRNRAHKVLAESWGIFEDDGTVRLKAINPSVREILELLDAKMAETTDDGGVQTVNLGEIIRMLCAPPYGCNLASSGLVLSLFIGRRKERLNLLKNNQPISIENWLQEAMPKNFFDLSVLDNTELVMVSAENLSEWDDLLEDWGLEKTFLGKIDYIKRARELSDRISIPPQLYYKYQHLAEQAKLARDNISAFNDKYEEALDKIQKGKEKDNINLLSWGASEIASLYYNMQISKHLWTIKQIQEVEIELAKVRLNIQKAFPGWLPHQKVASIKHLSKFSFGMKRIGSNLEELNLIEEKKMLEKQVEEVEKHINLIENMKRLATDINSFINKNVITYNTKISTLKNWLEQVQIFDDRIEEAIIGTVLIKNDLKKVAAKLAAFQDSCKLQIENYKERMIGIYDIEGFKTADEISLCRSEVNSLIFVYEGEEQDISDLKQVQKQLDLIEKHFRELSDDTLTEKEFNKLIKKSKKETEEAFTDDSPPLDYELIYESIAKVISNNRAKQAFEWIESYVPDIEIIVKQTASEVQRIKIRLQNKPASLSREQILKVDEALEACVNHLDNLEVEGLIARFNSLSPRSKTLFLQLVSDHLNT